MEPTQQHCDPNHSEKTQDKSRCRPKACRYGYAWRRTSGTTTSLIPTTLHRSARWWIRSVYCFVRSSRATVRWRDYQGETQTHQDNDWPSRKHPLLEMLFTMSTEHWKGQLLERLFFPFVSVIVHLDLQLYRQTPSSSLVSNPPGLGNPFCPETRWHCTIDSTLWMPTIVRVDIFTVQLNAARIRRGDVWGRNHCRRMTDKKRDLTLDFFRYDANSCGTHDWISSSLPHTVSLVSRLPLACKTF